MSFHEPASGSAPRRRNVATATMVLQQHADSVRAVGDVGRQAEQNQERQGQQRAAAGERVDEAREDADQGHGSEQQRVLVHAGSMRAACGKAPHSSRKRARYVIVPLAVLPRK